MSNPNIRSEWFSAFIHFLGYLTVDSNVVQNIVEICVKCFENVLVSMHNAKSIESLNRNQILCERLLESVMNCMRFRKAGLAVTRNVFKMIEEQPFIIKNACMTELYSRFLKTNDAQLTIPALKSLKTFLMYDSVYQTAALEICIRDEVLNRLKDLMTRSGKVTIVKNVLPLAVEIQR